MRFIPLLALSLAMGVAGCAGGHVDSYNRSVDSVHQPVVQRHDYIVDVIAGDQGLAPGEASRLDGWFESLHARYGDHVAVDTGAASNQAAASAIASVAASHGLRLSYHAPVTQGALAAGAVRVVLSRMTASVPGCPDQHEGILAQ
ncbi:MAG: hypothetical protein KGQ42_03090, partial [Alphaproteobacteria bacterium]|nr:hypothetical protein [Alphaproteobacteria bacterium]